MNKNQKVVLICTAIVIVILSLSPPFIEMGESGRVYGFSFLFSPPEDAIINVYALLTGYLGALIVGGLLTLAFKDKK